MGERAQRQEAIVARQADDHLKTQMEKYDRWITEGRIPAGSRVVSVRRPLAASAWVMPASQASAILERAGTIAVGECVCRSHYANCGSPRDVCLLLDGVAEAGLSKGKGRRVSTVEALEILDRASESGLVYLAVYSPDQPLLSLCSCCPCCCYQLGMLLAFDRKDMVVRSDYIVAHDRSLCDQCGLCRERCHFGAVVVADEGPEVASERCYGCGLCVAACPTGALSLSLRKEPAGA